MPLQAQQGVHAQAPLHHGHPLQHDEELPRTGDPEAGGAEQEEIRPAVGIGDRTGGKQFRATVKKL